MNRRRPDKFEDGTPFGCTDVVFEIHRDDIRGGETKFFCEFWSLKRIAKAGRLLDVFGKVTFYFGGYDDDIRAVYEIPEIREFMRRLIVDWPYFAYADSLKTEFLANLIKCTVQNTAMVTDDKNPTVINMAIPAGEAEKVYQALLDGFLKACQLHPGINDEIYNTRVNAFTGRIQKDFGVI